MTTAESLKRFRKSHNLRQVDVANALGITQQAYAVYEGGVDPGTKTLVRIADFFNVSTDYLLGRCDDPRGAAIGTIKVDKDIVQAALKFSAELNQILNRQN